MFDIDLGNLSARQVEIAVENCGYKFDAGWILRVLNVHPVEGYAPHTKWAYEVEYIEDGVKDKATIYVMFNAARMAVIGDF